MSRPALVSIQPPVQWVLRASSPRVKWPGLEANVLLPSGAEIHISFLAICNLTVSFLPSLFYLDERGSMLL
jgi:hypothetical protein